MKKNKDVSDEDEYSADDPEEVEGGSEEDWLAEAGTEVYNRRFYHNFYFYYSIQHIHKYQST